MASSTSTTLCAIGGVAVGVAVHGWWCAVFCALGWCALGGVKLYIDVQTLRYPKEYVTSGGAVAREHRPVSDVIFHVLVFKWRVLGDGYLFDRAMTRINSTFLSWDEPFATPSEAEAAVLAFCERWGVAQQPWVWDRPAREYTTMNEWFSRKHLAEHAPENNLGTADVVVPATAVVTWFESVEAMPRVVKNDAFTIDDCGFPPAFVSRCKAHPCTLHYLAPADYHCYHAPCSGTIVACNLLLHGKYSVTVKPYILGSINILKRNRRAVLVIESDGVGGEDKLQLQVGMVIIGGVTVDSIRLEDCVKEGARVRKGQRLGAFARGGSSIALFFSRPCSLSAANQAIVDSGRDFKLECGRDLVHV